MASQTVINAYLRRYSQAQIEAALDKALANLASGVVVTSMNFEGGGASGQIAGSTEALIEILEECLAVLDADGDAAKPRQMFVPVDFSAS